MNDIKTEAILDFINWLENESEDHLAICEFGPEDADPFPTYLTAEELVEKYKVNRNSKKTMAGKGL